MGPMATQLFYKMVTEATPAEKDQDHIEMVILSDTAMPDRTAAILSGQYEEVYTKMLRDAETLEKCGCQSISITCNTAHFFADMIKDKINIPIIHMIKETAKYIKDKNMGNKVAILATDGTIKTKLYQKALSDCELQYYTPGEENQRNVMFEIYQCIKKGKPYDAEKWASIEKEIKEAGCSMAILACTELSVIKADNDLSDYYVDPMEVLALKTIEFARCNSR